jgi:AraC-like DNA-binding protein
MPTEPRDFFMTDFVPQAAEQIRPARSDLATTTAARRDALASCEKSAYGAVVRHIRANLARRITVDELAQSASLSISQLARLLRREHATTPYGLVLAIRIEHAKDGLRGGAAIAETAFNTGFADQSHLTRHFKRVTGMTPKQFCAL